MTTRKFPRTLNEAFPRTAEYGCAIEVFKPRMPRHEKALYWVGALALIVLYVTY